MDRNPQAPQMADSSMIRTLAAQAACIWPQEAPLFSRYDVPVRGKIIDVGCGTGEIASRLAHLFPHADIVGVDLLEGPLDVARRRHSALEPRLRFELGDAFQLRFPSETFDLVVCRHLTQAVPQPEVVLAELVRVCRRGGWIHVLSEDYAMLHFPCNETDLDRLWRQGLGCYAKATGVDERIGRRTWAILKRLGLTHLSVDYAIVDTQRVPRETFAEILRAWRDGYAADVQALGQLEPGEASFLFDRIIATILDPNQYAAWHVPIIGGRASTPAHRNIPDNAVLP
jgi:ubiquinone/menaquinone biosynthesis C-methylase UbiE